MYDVAALEHEWKRYRRKRLLLPIAAVVAIGIVVGSGWSLWHSSAGSDKSEAVTRANTTLVTPTTRTAAATSLAPVVPSMQTPDTASEPRMKIVFSGSGEKTHPSAPSKPKKVMIEVTSKESTSSVKEIASRFAFAKDKDDALFLARYYYDKKQYKKALKWALETNKIDSDIEESWLIFAKSKARLGQRIEAIRVLQAYYDRSGSAKAKRLLSLIRRGKAF